MLVLGVHCSSGTAFFSLLEDGELRDSGPTRLTATTSKTCDEVQLLGGFRSAPCRKR